MPMGKMAGTTSGVGAIVALTMLASVSARADTCVSLLAAMPHRDATVDVRLRNSCSFDINLVHCQSSWSGIYACPSFDRLPANRIGTFLFELYARDQMSGTPPASYLSWCAGDKCERALGDGFRGSGGNPKSLGEFIPLADGQGNILTKK